MNLSIGMHGICRILFRSCSTISTREARFFFRSSIFEAAVKRPWFLNLIFASQRFYKSGWRTHSSPIWIEMKVLPFLFKTNLLGWDPLMSPLHSPSFSARKRLNLNLCFVYFFFLGGGFQDKYSPNPFHIFFQVFVDWLPVRLCEPGYDILSWAIAVQRMVHWLKEPGAKNKNIWVKSSST